MLFTDIGGGSLLPRSSSTALEPVVKPIPPCAAVLLKILKA